jgi:elongation factor G
VRKDIGSAPDPRAPERVRNVAVVGPAGAGKTTLVEALLARAGAIPRPGRVEDGTTTCDTEPVEVRTGRSVTLAVAQLEHGGHKLNLLDTPGTPDLVGELRAGLRAADAALFVVSAAGGVDAVTAQLWEECDAVGMPRAVVVTQLDRPRADFDEAVAVCQRVLGEPSGDIVVPLHLPVHDDDGAVAGVVDLLTQRISDSSSGERVVRDADPEHLPLLTTARDELIEAVIAESEDEGLMEAYLAGEVDVDVLVRDLETAVARGHLHPALAVVAPADIGTSELLDLLVAGFPSPCEHPLPRVTRPDGSPAAPIGCDPGGPLVAEVVRTTTDPYVGRLSVVRVFSGTLRPDVAVHVSGHGLADRGHPDHDVDERVGPLSSLLGATLRPVASAPAGDVCAVAKLTSAETGDTLSDPADPLLVAPWDLPEPQLPVAVEAASRADEDRLATALQRLAAEDPTLRVEQRAETGQQLLWCVGETHAEVVLDRLRTRHGVEVDTPDVAVPLCETLARPVTVTGRQVKQSGGHGQYAVVVLEVAPGEPGSGITFAQRVVGGSVPSQFHSSVEKGVRAQAERGVTPGRPLVDLQVVLVDGKAHSVDSSDAAFQAAAAGAVREAVATAGARVLEPVCEVDVTVPSGYVGSVMSDLAGRRARVTGSEPHPEREDRTVVRAEVPEAELVRYASALRAVSHGTGTVVRRPLGLQPAPA